MAVPHATTNTCASWCLSRDALREEIRAAFEDLVLPVLAKTQGQIQAHPPVRSRVSRPCREQKEKWEDVLVAQPTPQGWSSERSRLAWASKDEVENWDDAPVQISERSICDLPLTPVLPNATQPEILIVKDFPEHEETRRSLSSGDEADFAGKARLDYVQELLGNDGLLCRDQAGAKLLSFPDLQMKLGLSSLKEMASLLVKSTTFDYAICAVILLNALLIGIQTDLMAKGYSHESKSADIMDVLEIVFLVIFTCELLVRMFASGRTFFTGAGWQWNMFDSVLVGQQLVEHVLAAMAQHDSGMNLSFARVLRILRLIRVMRLVRMLRLIRELRTLVSSITGSLKSLGWTVLLLSLMIYTVSLYITQTVSEEIMSNVDQGPHSDTLSHFYGSVPRTMLTLFQAITGGEDWELLLTPLIEEVSPVLALLFLLYISFTLFAMMNVVTGVFVDSVLTSARMDKDHMLVSNAKEILRTVEGGKLTLHMFENRIDTSEMQEFFKGIDVDASEAKTIFRILDSDDSGEIDAEEFLSGCIRLRGPARAVDASVMMREIRKIKRYVKEGQKLPRSQIRKQTDQSNKSCSTRSAGT